ncbi:DUF2141 domain-containing protein [Kordiimonas aestuarii]|uniref:DUF2141 domain-containing protein n=1 Tax=Kordiimonas aestuarii TaxID=1005925 RepID=UPI0021D1B3D7|nr:DUF2141 domain-containing protein [Kordiimonas aestuarii]
MRTLTKSLMALSLAGIMLGAVPAGAADLTVKIGNIREAKGNILIAVYDTPENFLRPGGMTAGMKLQAATEGVSHTFAGLEAGTYAVSVFHDVNGDGKLESNYMGVPQEPVGMSRDARGSFGPPAFTDAAFTLPQGGSVQKIDLY